MTNKEWICELLEEAGLHARDMDTGVIGNWGPVGNRHLMILSGLPNKILLIRLCERSSHSSTIIQDAVNLDGIGDDIDVYFIFLDRKIGDDIEYMLREKLIKQVKFMSVNSFRRLLDQYKEYVKHQGGRLNG